MTIVLNTKGIDTWDIYLHDPQHLTLNDIHMYGSDQLTISKNDAGTHMFYNIEPTEVIHVNQGHKPCIKENINVKNIWDCVSEHLNKGIYCSLPWFSNYVGPLCSLPEEYHYFHKKTMESMFYLTADIEKNLNCIPACHRIAYSAKPHKKLNRPKLTDKIEISIFFGRDEFTVREQYLIYDYANFVADFGGYLGLLLGYSVLGFYDTLADLIKTIVQKFKKRLPRKEHTSGHIC